MALENRISQMEIITKDVMFKDKRMEKVNISGKMELYFRDSLSKVIEMVKEVLYLLMDLNFKEASKIK